jgi:hypothetical protein
MFHGIGTLASVAGLKGAPSGGGDELDDPHTRRFTMICISALQGSRLENIGIHPT